jgi:hypothetical protein
VPSCTLQSILRPPTHRASLPRLLAFRGRLEGSNPSCAVQLPRQVSIAEGIVVPVDNHAFIGRAHMGGRPSAVHHSWLGCCRDHSSISCCSVQGTCDAAEACGYLWATRCIVRPTLTGTRSTNANQPTGPVGTKRGLSAEVCSVAGHWFALLFGILCIFVVEPVHGAHPADAGASVHRQHLWRGDDVVLHTLVSTHICLRHTFVANASASRSLEHTLFFADPPGACT